MKDKVNIAIDAMGGDNSPSKIIEGINISIKTNKDCFFILFGNEEKIKKELKRNNIPDSYFQIINTNDVILDKESPFTAAKKGKESSMWKAIESLKNKKADICLSAGNTGALLSSSLLLLGKIDKIRRPALGAYIPTDKGGFVLCDVGANSNNKPIHILQFSLMAKAYIKYLENIERPKIIPIHIPAAPNLGPIIP